MSDSWQADPNDPYAQQGDPNSSQFMQDLATLPLATRNALLSAAQRAYSAAKGFAQDPVGTLKNRLHEAATSAQARQAESDAAYAKFQQSGDPGDFLNAPLNAQYAQQLGTGFQGTFIGTKGAANVPGLTDKIAGFMRDRRAGMPDRTAWEKYGVFTGKGGEPMAEIPNNRATVLPEGVNKALSGAPTLLSKVYHDPDLFGVYPELADTTVVHDASDPGGAYYRSGDNKIGMDLTAPPETLLKNFGHETQHWVQNAEGHPVGGNLLEFLPKTPAQQNNLEQALGPRLIHAPSRSYLGIPGEVTARVTENSMPMTAEERAASYPVDRMTADGYPYDSQLRPVYAKDGYYLRGQTPYNYVDSAWTLKQTTAADGSPMSQYVPTRTAGFSEGGLNPPSLRSRLTRDNLWHQVDSRAVEPETIAEPAAQPSINSADMQRVMGNLKAKGLADLDLAFDPSPKDLAGIMRRGQQDRLAQMQMPPELAKNYPEMGTETRLFIGQDGVPKAAWPAKAITHTDLAKGVPSLSPYAENPYNSVVAYKGPDGIKVYNQNMPTSAGKAQGLSMEEYLAKYKDKMEP